MTINEVREKYPPGSVITLPLCGECRIVEYRPYQVKLEAVNSHLIAFIAEGMFARYITEYIE